MAAYYLCDFQASEEVDEQICTSCFLMFLIFVCIQASSVASLLLEVKMSKFGKYMKSAQHTCHQKYAEDHQRGAEHAAFETLTCNWVVCGAITNFVAEVCIINARVDKTIRVSFDDVTSTIHPK